MKRRRTTTPFVGRQAELAEVKAAWADVCQGQSAGFLISGEAGVGKTRLLAECVESVRSEGGQALYGACVRISTGGLPYGPILDTLRRLLQDSQADSLADVFGPSHAHLDQLLRTDGPAAPTTGTVPAPLRQGQIFEGFLALLTALSQEEPLLLMIDDIHWAEQSTLDLLSFLTVALRRERVLLLVTYRDDEPATGLLPAALLELVRSPFMTKLDLAPFTPSDLRVLLEALSGAALPAESVRRIADLSGGNAFFAEELLATQGIDGAGPLPAHVRDVVLLRIAALSPAAQDVVRLAAVIGRRSGHALLREVSELPERDLLDALRELVTHRILVAENATSYRFRHALSQEAVYSELLPGERASLHALVAAALSDKPHLAESPKSTMTAVIAHHWQASGDSARALAATVAAGRAATEIHGYAEGLQYFRRALVLWDEVPDPGVAGLDRPDLLGVTARCAYYSGRHEEAVQLVTEAIDHLAGDDVLRHALLEEARGSYLSRLDGARALKSLETAYRLLAGDGATAGRARVTAALASALSNRGRYAESARYWEETLELSRQAGCRREEVLGLRTSGWHLATHGEPEAGIGQMREALRVALDDGDPECIAVCYNHLGLVLDFVGQSTEALATVREGLRWSAEFGAAFTPTLDMLDSFVLVLFRLGRWRQAEEIADRLYASHGRNRAVMAASVLAELAAARGNWEQAARELKVAHEMLDGDEDPLNHGLVHAAATARALWLEEHGTARTQVRRGLEMVASRGDDQQAVALCALGLRVEADEAERRRARGLGAALDDVRERGEELLAQARTLWHGMGARRASFPEAAAEAAMAEAEFERLTGHPSPAWAGIGDAWEKLDRPYPLAYARWRQAEALVQRRDPQAAEVLRQAATLADALRADTLSSEIAALARRARIDLAVRGDAAPVTPAHPFNLTDREVQVLALVKAGRRNREIARALFISESTASVHVSNILTKLDVKNRVEAAAVAHRLHLAEPPQAEQPQAEAEAS